MSLSDSSDSMPSLVDSSSADERHGDDDSSDDDASDDGTFHLVSDRMGKPKGTFEALARGWAMSSRANRKMGTMGKMFKAKPQDCLDHQQHLAVKGGLLLAAADEALMTANQKMMHMWRRNAKAMYDRWRLDYAESHYGTNKWAIRGMWGSLVSVEGNGKVEGTPRGKDNDAAHGKAKCKAKL